MASEAKSELQEINLLTLAGASSIAVASTGVAYSHAFQPPKNGALSLELQFASDAAVDVKVDIEHGGSKPGTEAASDTNFVVGDSVDPIAAGIVDELVHFIAASPIVTPWMRFKFTGQGSNAASTTVTRAIVRIARNA